MNAHGAGFEVVVVGSLNRDYVCRVDALPGPGQTVLGGEVCVGSGGKGGNQAAAASRLGARTAMVGRVGDDDDGRALVADLAAAGVATDEVVAVPDVRTGLALVLVDRDGENGIVVAPGANGRLRADAVARTLTRLLRPPAVLVTQAEIPAPAFEKAIEVADHAGCRAIVNLAPYRELKVDFLAVCDPLVVNASRGQRGCSAARSSVSMTPRKRPPTYAGARDRWWSPWVRWVPWWGSSPGSSTWPPSGSPSSTRPARATPSPGALAGALSRGAGLVEAVRLGVRAGTYAVGRSGAQASFADADALGMTPRSDPV